jgi:outer membrane protein TolC
MTRLMILFVLLSVSVPAAAQPPLQISLPDAVRRTLERSPRVAEIRARETAARATVVARQALAWPTVTAVTGVLRTNHVDEFGVVQPNGQFRVLFPDIPGNYRLRGEMAVPLYTGGRVSALIAAAEAEGRAVEAERRAAEAEIGFETARAYWALATSRGRVEVLEQTMTRNDAWVRDVRARVDAGLLPPNDVLSAEAQRARQSVRLIQARQDAALAEMTLGRLIGEAPGRPIALATAVTDPNIAAAELSKTPVETLVTRALETRSERTALIDRAAAARSSAQAAAAARAPQVSGVAAVEPARPNARFVPRTDEWRTSWDLGVSLTWPVWDAGRSRAEQAAALAQADAIAERVREFDELVAIEIRERRMAMATAREALEASAQAVAAASEARRVIEERFAAGVATSTDVLDAQLALLEAELERTELTASLRVAEARLQRAVEAR